MWNQKETTTSSKLPTTYENAGDYLLCPPLLPIVNGASSKANCFNIGGRNFEARGVDSYSEGNSSSLRLG